MQITYSTLNGAEKKDAGVETYDAKQQGVVPSAKTQDASEPATKYRMRKLRNGKMTRKTKTITTPSVYQSKAEYVCPCEADSYATTESYVRVEETTRPPKKCRKKSVKHSKTKTDKLS
jgi:Tfp pilus assembly protein PilV